MGFSKNTCFPVWSIWIVLDSWILCGRKIAITSISSPARARASSIVSYGVQGPSARAATIGIRAGLVSTKAVTSIGRLNFVAALR